jgi:hypothetical protein
MSNRSYQGQTCPARDWIVSVETDVNIRWSDMFDQTKKDDKFRQKATDILAFIFSSKYLGKRFVDVETSSVVTYFP